MSLLLEKLAGLKRDRRIARAESLAPRLLQNGDVNAYQEFMKEYGDGIDNFMNSRERYQDWDAKRMLANNENISNGYNNPKRENTKNFVEERIMKKHLNNNPSVIKKGDLLSRVKRDGMHDVSWNLGSFGKSDGTDFASNNPFVGDAITTSKINKKINGKGYVDNIPTNIHKDKLKLVGDLAEDGKYFKGTNDIFKYNPNESLSRQSNIPIWMSKVPNVTTRYGDHITEYEPSKKMLSKASPIDHPHLSFDSRDKSVEEIKEKAEKFLKEDTKAPTMSKDPNFERVFTYNQKDFQDSARKTYSKAGIKNGEHYNSIDKVDFNNYQSPNVLVQEHSQGSLKDKAIRQMNAGTGQKHLFSEKENERLKQKQKRKKEKMYYLSESRGKVQDSMGNLNDIKARAKDKLEQKKLAPKIEQPIQVDGATNKNSLLMPKLNEGQRVIKRPKNNGTSAVSNVKDISTKALSPIIGGGERANFGSQGAKKFTGADPSKIIDITPKTSNSFNNASSTLKSKLSGKGKLGLGLGLGALGVGALGAGAYAYNKHKNRNKEEKVAFEKVATNIPIHMPSNDLYSNVLKTDTDRVMGSIGRIKGEPTKHENPNAYDNYKKGAKIVTNTDFDFDKLVNKGGSLGSVIHTTRGKGRNTNHIKNEMYRVDEARENARETGNEERYDKTISDIGPGLVRNQKLGNGVRKGLNVGGAILGGAVGTNIANYLGRRGAGKLLSSSVGTATGLAGFMGGHLAGRGIKNKIDNSNKRKYLDNISGYEREGIQESKNRANYINAVFGPEGNN